MLHRTLFLLCFAYLTFMAGVAWQYYGLPGTPLAEKAFAAGEAAYMRYVSPHFVSPDTQDAKDISTADTVNIYKPEKTYGDYTLITVPKSSRALLLDMTGNVVHEWQRDFSQLDVEMPATQSCAKKHIQWARIHAFANGNLLVMYVCQFSQIPPAGMALLDKFSNVIWYQPVNAHHDLEVLNNGNILTLTTQMQTEPHPDLPYLKPPYFLDAVAMLNLRGSEFRTVPILPAFKDTPYEKYVKELKQVHTGDYTHVNSVHWLTPEYKKMPFYAEQRVLVSLRDMNALAVIDMNSKKVVWFKKGVWKGQHHARMQKDGSLLLFDNNGYKDAEKRTFSRILKINPSTGKILWSYDGTVENQFLSGIRGTQQMLPNGNILINQSYGARIFEITPQNEIVWRYRYPLNEDPHFSNVLITAKRYTAKDLPFLIATPSTPSD